MLIYIQPHELLGRFKNNQELIESMYNLGIDYETNTLDCVFEDACVPVFSFKKYGFLQDNRWSTYEISKGSAGILIEIVISKEEY